jgi:hypothetical protein
MCGAPDNCATLMSLTPTLSRHKDRELERRGNWNQTTGDESDLLTFIVLTGP